jgi:hypothetical protein
VRWTVGGLLEHVDFLIICDPWVTTLMNSLTALGVEEITDRTYCSRQLIQNIKIVKLEGFIKSTSSKKKKRNNRKKAYAIRKKNNKTLQNNANVKDAGKAQVRKRKKTDGG